MRLTLARAAALCLALLLPGSSFSPAATPEKTPGTAERLVQAALVAEIENNPAQRQRLLAEALKLDPNSAPAQWHSGFVRIGDQWVQLDDVPRQTAAGQRSRAGVGRGPTAGCWTVAI